MRQRPQKQIEKDVLDEQEQEEVIASLRHENHAASKFFRFAIAALCLLMSTAFAYTSSTQRAMVTSLSITSLVMTCFTLRYLPNESHDALDGPLANYLPLMNTILAALVVVVARLRLTRRQSWSDVLLSLDVIPLVLLALSTLLRYSSARTERSIIELERQRYHLRGA